MSEVVKCEKCGGSAWIIAETPAGPTLTCHRCGAEHSLEALVNLEGVRHA